MAIGGTSALTACLEQEQEKLGEEGTPTASADEPQFPRGDPETVPDGQYRWGEYLVRDAHGNTVPPQQLVVVGLDYEGSAPPTDAERTQVERSLDLLDRAFQWGTGGNAGAAFTRGLLFMIGYAPSYFEQVGTSVPEGVTPPETVLESVDEDPTKADSYDAVLSETEQVVSQTANVDYLSQDSRVEHVGVSDHETVTLHVRWPDGTERRFENVSVNQRLRVTKSGLVVSATTDSSA